VTPALAREPNSALVTWARIAERCGNDPDPLVKAFASLGLIAKAELERRATERRAKAERASTAGGRVPVLPTLPASPSVAQRR
jgi:hypothetical protein